jgi:hypothetical protein
MRIILILSTILLLCPWHMGRAQSGNASLAGTWNIQKVELRQTVDNGAPTVKVFNSGDDASSTFVQLPAKITFTVSNVTFEYAGRQEIGTYYTENNKLHVKFPDQPSEYTYTLSGGNLQLGSVVNYVINEGGQVFSVAEQYTFYGQK